MRGKTRGEVADEVGELIWDSPVGGSDQAGSWSAATRSPPSRSAWRVTHGGSSQSPGLLTAIIDLRGVLSPAAAAPGTA